MKTIPEVSDRYGIHRDTLRKAAMRGAFPARKASKRTYLIDDESPAFQRWLEGRERKIDPMTKWIERPSYYLYPTLYTSQMRAAKAAQKLAEKHKIFTETLQMRNECGDIYFGVITKNDVPH